MNESLTSDEQGQLIWKLRCGLVSLRLAVLAGDLDRVADIADAFHNVPRLLLPASRYTQHWTVAYFTDHFLKPLLEKYPDVVWIQTQEFGMNKSLTSNEKRQLILALDRALISTRFAALAGDLDRAADIADAFHNVPTLLLPVSRYTQHWTVAYFTDFFLKPLLEKYRDLAPIFCEIYPVLNKAFYEGR